MSQDAVSISVIMPAYNEGPNVEQALTKTRDTFESIGSEYEIIIIDDCSVDETGDLTESFANKYPEISCYRNETNLGAGGAFKKGIEHAKKDYVIFVPFDNPITSDDLRAYLPRMGICDIIVGVRVERVGYSPFSRFASFVYNRIFIPCLFNIGVSDVNWISAYRRNLFADKIIDFRPSRIFFLVEILIIARRKQLIVVEVPSRMIKRAHGKSSSSRIGVMWETFWDMWRFFAKSR